MIRKINLSFFCYSGELKEFEMQSRPICDLNYLSPGWKCSFAGCKSLVFDRMRAFGLLPELNPFLTQMKEQEEGNFICCEKKWKRVHKLPSAVELLGWNQKKGFESSEKHKLHQEWMFRVNGCAGVGLRCAKDETPLKTLSQKILRRQLSHDLRRCRT